MNQTNGLFKREDNPALLPSCFLSPESPQDKLLGRRTPSFETSPSSVFLTPPSSQEKASTFILPSPVLHGVPKLNFELEDADQAEFKQQRLRRSHLLPEDRIIGRLMGRTCVDFISDLKALNCNAICQKICKYLDNRDLCRFSSVCTKWREFVKADVLIGLRWKKFISERHNNYALKGKENCGLLDNHKLSSFGEPHISRVPLSKVNSNVQLRGKQTLLSSNQRDVETPKPMPVCCHSASAQPLIKLRPCPKCTSPSNRSKTQEGHCQCQRCGFKFCSMCLRDTDQHDTSIKCDGLSFQSQGTNQRLRFRNQSKDIVGSRKSKDRIRRL